MRNLRERSERAIFAFAPRARRALSMLMRDAAVAVLAGTLAFLLRFDFVIPHRYLVDWLVATSIWVLVKPIIHLAGGFDRSPWKFVSVPDVSAILRWTGLSSLLSLVVIATLSSSGFPRSVYFLDFILFLAAVVATRIAVRTYADRRRNRGPRKVRRKVLIYGAGFSGAKLIREFQQDLSLGYLPVGLIDDDPRKTGTAIHRVPVLGKGLELAQLAQGFKVDLVLIATPSASAAEMMAIVQHCNDAQVRFKTIPALSHLISEEHFAGQLREVSMDDVLGRQPVSLDHRGLLSLIEGKVVLVTGAAGSIGSELCRQIGRLHPSKLIALDNAETALFHLGGEMRTRFPELTFVSIVGNVQSELRLREVFESFLPSAVYHAAAYKHVPLMETSLFEAVENNALGTYNVALAAEAAGVNHFVLISSDKAVRPANVMGATKRVAELIACSMQRQSQTKFVSVRFGNVLGSNGSVVPTFLKQIAAGGPVTVTHPEMRRYFMTIPEASQLVLQASLLGEGGEVFVLDMGEQVRIVDLARKLILLSGRRLDEDIQITFTGTRPGEKLYEELNLEDECTIPTIHQKVRRFQGNSTLSDLHGQMTHISNLCRRRDHVALLVELRRLVPEYEPALELPLTETIVAPSPKITAALVTAG